MVKMYLNEFEDLVSLNSDSLILLMFLRRHYRNLEFYLGNDTHRKLGWTRRRFVKARNVLIDRGDMIMVEPPRNAPMICQLMAAA
jgi:hypothetical protein